MHKVSCITSDHHCEQNDSQREIALKIAGLLSRNSYLNRMIVSGARKRYPCAMHSPTRKLQFDHRFVHDTRDTEIRHHSDDGTRMWIKVEQSETTALTHCAVKRSRVDRTAIDGDYKDKPYIKSTTVSMLRSTRFTVKSAEEVHMWFHLRSFRICFVEMIFHFIAAPAAPSKDLTLQKLQSKFASVGLDTKAIFSIDIPTFKVGSY
jgi:hypothetical protein